MNMNRRALDDAESLARDAALGEIQLVAAFLSLLAEDREHNSIYRENSEVLDAASRILGRSASALEELSA